MTFLEELVNAAIGVFNIAIGKRDAAKYFNLTIVGLLGATIAIIITLGLNGYAPAILGSPIDGVSSSKLLVYTAGVFAFQTSSALIILNLLNRLDALVPYLVVDFWAGFFITIISLSLNILKIESDFLLITLAILILIIKINTIRIIIKLPIQHIILFFVAHLFAGLIGMIVLGSIMEINVLTLSSQT